MIEHSAFVSRVSRAALFFATMFGAAVTSCPASAQPSDPVTEVARQRYKDGVKAYDAGSFDDARQAFAQAYQLKHLPVVLLNLGLSEEKSGHVADGGNHLLQFLREYKEAKPDEIASANAGIDDAKHKVAQVAVTVNQAGAEVALDGVGVGKSPIGDPLFAEPGTHTVTATVNGNTGSTKVDATKGQTVVATVTIGGGAPPPPGLSTPPSTNPEIPPSVTPAPPPGEFSPGTPQAIEPAPGQGDSGDHDQGFGHWYAHHPVAYVGTGVAGVGLILGIAFSAAAGAQASNVNTLADSIRTAEGANKTPPCSQDGSADRKGFTVACGSLRDAISSNKTDNIVGGVGWGRVRRGGCNDGDLHARRVSEAERYEREREHPGDADRRAWLCWGRRALLTAPPNGSFSTQEIPKRGPRHAGDSRGRRDPPVATRNELRRFRR